MKSPRRSLGRTSSYWVVAAVVVHTLWASAAPSMSYPLFAARWELSTLTITAVFATFHAFIVLSILLFGDAVDYLGRRKTLFLAVLASTIGAALFAAASGPAWLFVARAFMGFGVGLSVGVASAALIEFSPPDRVAQASGVNAVSQAVGIAAATLVGGALIQYGPWPTRLNFTVLCAFLAALCTAVWFLPDAPGPKAHVAWNIRGLTRPSGSPLELATAATSIMTSYGIGGIMMSLGSHTARDLVASANVLVNGSAIALMALVAGAAGLVGLRMDAVRATVVGGLGAVIAMTIFFVSVRRADLLLFVAAVGLFGISYALSYLGALKMVTVGVDASNRGASLATGYLLAYVFQATTVLSLGAVATRAGLSLAIELGAIGIALVGTASVLLALAVAHLRRRRLGPGDPTPDPRPYSGPDRRGQAHS